mgnify:CR=1 FL=1
MTEILGRDNDPIPSCRPSLGLGNTSQSRDPGGRRLGSTKNAAHRARPMIHSATVGLFCGSEILARAEILTSGEHHKRSIPGKVNDSPGYCRPSLGLGNTSQSRDPGGRRLGSTKNAAHRAGPMIRYPTVGPLWGSEIPDIVVCFVVCMCVASVVCVVV